MIIEIDGYEFDADVDKTAEYYNNITLCDCPCCRNYYTSAAEKMPELAEMLLRFGVDIAKPDEIFWSEHEGKCAYDQVSYTVCGSIKRCGEYEIDLYGEGYFVSIVPNNDYVPNQQTEEYFVLNVFGVALDWVLDEPFEETPLPPKSKWRLAKTCAIIGAVAAVLVPILYVETTGVGLSADVSRIARTVSFGFLLAACVITFLERKARGQKPSIGLISITIGLLIAGICLWI